MEALGSALKVFAEKHLIPTVLSLLVGAIIYSTTPTNFWFLIKLTKFGYWLFASGFVFIIIQLLLWLKNGIGSVRYHNYLRRSNNEYDKKEEQQALNQLWQFVDGFDQEDRDYLKKFVESKNIPIKIRGYRYYSYGKLFASDNIVNKQSGYDETGSYTMYKLKDNFYQFLKYSYETYGKISNFD